MIRSTSLTPPPLPLMTGGAQIRHYPGNHCYAVTDHGEVYSCALGGRGQRVYRAAWKRLRPKTKTYGHREVSLGRDNFSLVHRLVLETYVGPCPAGMEACHNNGDAADNHVSNLRWDCHLNNQRDRDKHGTTPRGEGHAMAKLKAEDVVAIRKNDDGTKHYASTVAPKYGVEPCTVRRILSGRLWKSVT